MLRLTLTLAVFASLVAPPALEEIGPVAFTGTWEDPENFSGVARVGNRLVIASDEEGYLQTGLLDTSGPAWTVARDTGKEVVLTPGALTKQIELDIEALAANGTTVYALGSHSATRQRADGLTRTYEKNRERLTGEPESKPLRDVVARFTLDGATGAVTKLETVSLRPFLDAAPLMRPFTGQAAGAPNDKRPPSPSKENGIDLEGLAVDGTALFAGFRGPVLRHGLVPVLKFAFDKPAGGKWLFVPLDGRGVRDMAKVDDGFLVLAGPVGDGDAPHRLYLWNGKDCVPGSGNPGGTLRWLADVPAPSSAAPAARAAAKAEALLVTATAASSYDLLVLYDSLPNGGATRFRVAKAGSGETAATRLCGARP